VPAIPAEMGTLVSHVDAVRHARRNADLIRALAVQLPNSPKVCESVDRLIKSDSVVVIANVYAALFGGPVSQFLKCLTAIKICEELKKKGTDAIPVCWLQPDPPPDFSKWSINLIDGNGEIHHLELSPGGCAIDDRITELISEIRGFGNGVFDSEILDMLESVFVPGEAISSASARLISSLMENWGMIVFDSNTPEPKTLLKEALAPLQSTSAEIRDLLEGERTTLAERGHAHPFPDAEIPMSLIQSFILPILARVVDPYEIYSTAAALPVFARTGVTAPAYWPAASATVGDMKSRRTLARYNLRLVQLFSGDREVLRRTMESVPRGAAEKLRVISAETETRITELKSLLPVGSELHKTADSCARKVLYQLQKLKNHLEASLNTKEQTAGRQIRKACNLLAPGQEVQERKLAGVQIPLSYSRDGLRRLYEKLEILTFEHQLIWMD
jgi:uncharacterized protein YllA (UPF0747 family)